MKGKETEGKLKMKRARQSERDREEDRDRLSDLPDCVLLHILKFMDTKHAVQTCVLSKSWENLWKSLSNLTLHSKNFNRVASFSKFVSGVLSRLPRQDGSISLHNLDLKRHGFIEPSLLNKVITYAELHNVQQLTINVESSGTRFYKMPSCIFSCGSLTFLKLSIRTVELPKSLELPALKSLHLKYVTFSIKDNDCAEPFSTCNMLNNLVIEGCFLHPDAQVLCISNYKLSSLTIGSIWEVAYKIGLSTPKLSSLTITGDLIHQLSSACNLSFLEEVNIDICHAYSQKTDLAVISWLQALANVKIMTLSSSTLNIILNVLSNHGSMTAQPPCFVRLKSLKMKSFASISKEGVSRIVEYLLQNSPLARVDIINC